jgi:hypothetical protein
VLISFSGVRSIGTLIPNVVTEELHDDEMAITIHPVETGCQSPSLLRSAGDGRNVLRLVPPIAGGPRVRGKVFDFSDAAGSGCDSFCGRRSAKRSRRAVPSGPVGQATATTSASPLPPGLEQ